MHDDSLTPYMRTVLSGESPTAEQWREHLIEFYRRVDDNAEHSVLLFDRDVKSYDRLARAASGSYREILDVGCGDGLLAEALERANPQSHITGVDISAAELDRLRRRLPRATGICADVCAMPIADDTFDLVASHLVLMHVDDLDLALNEMRRVLRPNGTLAFAVVSRGDASSNAWWPFEAASLAIREFAPSFRPATFQDTRLADKAALTGLLHAHDFAGGIEFEDYEAVSHLSPSVLCRIVDRSYHVALLPDKIREAVAIQVKAESQRRLDAQGTVGFGVSMQLVVARG